MSAQATGSRESTTAWVCRRYASLINGFWMLLGSLVFLHAMSFVVQLQQQGHWRSFSAMAGNAWQAYSLVIRSCVACFVEAAQVKVADVPEMDFDVWVCFVPAITSFFFCFTASLGMNLMRRPIPGLALLYIVCASILVAFQAEFLQALAELRSLEDPRIQSAVFDSGKLFKEGSKAFDYVWEKEGCQLIGDELRCNEPLTLKASLFPSIVQEFCLSQDSRSFKGRVQSCQTAGLELLWENTDSADRNSLYCSCWVAVFDLIESVFLFTSSMLLSYWTAVLCVLYVAVEPCLLKRGATGQLEVWSFALLGTCATLLKVVWIAHFPRGETPSLTR